MPGGCGLPDRPRILHCGVSATFIFSKVLTGLFAERRDYSPLMLSASFVVFPGPFMSLGHLRRSSKTTPVVQKILSISRFSLEDRVAAVPLSALACSLRSNQGTFEWRESVDNDCRE